MSKEKRLNEQFSEIYSEDQAVESFIYLTNKSRGKATTENNIRKAYREGKLGSLLKRLDFTAFSCA